MNNEQITIGMKVRAIEWNGDFTSIGVVQELPNKNEEVKIKWNKGNSKPELVPLKYVQLYDPEADKELGQKIQSKIDEAKSSFENAFRAYKNAQELCQDNLYGLEEAGLISTKELEQVIDEAGWSSSSLRC